MAEFISLRAYARRRKCALSAVQKAIESRRVTAIREDDNGRITGIDPEEADRQWAAHTDPIEAERNGRMTEASAQPVAVAVAPSPAAAAAPVQTPGDDQGNFLQARIKEAELRGQLLELDKLERVDELIPRSVAQREISEIFTELKSSVFRIPDRKAQALAGETDPTRIHRLLSDEIRMVFDDYSRRLAGPAGVVEDSGLAAERQAVLP